MAREKIDWFTLWREDKEGMVETMLRNLQADLDVGYDPNGKAVRDQLEEIQQYRARYAADLDHIADMEPRRVQHWCYCQLLKAGAI